MADGGIIVHHQGYIEHQENCPCNARICCGLPSKKRAMTGFEGIQLSLRAAGNLKFVKRCNVPMMATFCRHHHLPRRAKQQPSYRRLHRAYVVGVALGDSALCLRRLSVVAFFVKRYAAAAN